jgi:V/A-type H+-transporting ATPase subunit F
MKIMVIGHPQAVLGFSLAGVHGLAAGTPAQANQALETAFATPDTGIILVTEETAALLGARMDQLRLRSTIPLVVEIPGPDTSASDRQTLKEVVFRAIGVKI